MNQNPANTNAAFDAQLAADAPALEAMAQEVLKDNEVQDALNDPEHDEAW